MKTRLFILLFLLLVPCAAICAQNDIQHPDGVVAYCFDGDTVKLKDRRIVRLAGIDAPETARNNNPAQYYSSQAREALESLVRGKKVHLQFPGEGLHDRYGRLIANLILPDGESVNEHMVSIGAAYFYPHADLDPAFQEKLRELQEDAIRERLGMWDGLLSMSVARQHYIGNKNSKRFFPTDCPTAQNIRPRNKENFGTLMDAFLAGYAPARICIFWPEEKQK